MSLSCVLLSTIAPQGSIRTLSRASNSALARLNNDGQFAGPSVFLAPLLGARQDVELELVVADAAGRMAGAFTCEDADASPFAVDPLRSKLKRTRSVADALQQYSIKRVVVALEAEAP